MPPLDLDTPIISDVRDHLLRLSRTSFEPTHGGRRAREGSPEEDAVIDRFRPFAELFLLVAAADGTIDDAERAVILGAFRGLTGGRVRSSTLETLEREIQAVIAASDTVARLEGVCAHLAGDRQDAELAFTLASAVALADENVDPSEVELLRTLASWLSIREDRAIELLCGPTDGASQSG